MLLWQGICSCFSGVYWMVRRQGMEYKPGSIASRLPDKKMSPTGIEPAAKRLLKKNDLLK